MIADRLPIIGKLVSENNWESTEYEKVSITDNSLKMCNKMYCMLSIILCKKLLENLLSASL